MEYVDCSRHFEGSLDCQRNIECVETNGGSMWCTGPKIKQCYTYYVDPVTNEQVAHFY